MTALAPVGANATRLWGLTAEERLRRIAVAQKLEVRSDGELLVNLGYAFDPGWLKLAAARPGLVVTRYGVPVLANVGPDEDIRAAMEQDLQLPAPGQQSFPGEGRGPAAPAGELGPGLRRETLAWEDLGARK